MMKCKQCGMETDAQVCPLCQTQISQGTTLSPADEMRDAAVPAAAPMPHQSSAVTAPTYAAYTKAPNTSVSTQKWYKKTWACVVFLIFFWPVGLFLMWRYSSWNKVVKIIVSVIIAFGFISYITTDKTTPPSKTTAPAPISRVSSTVIVSSVPEAPSAESVSEAPPAVSQNTLQSVAQSTNDTQSSSAPASEATTTTGQRNARKAASNYLAFMAFSRSGLIEQLKYEGYSEEEAIYAVDNITVDWNEQAAKSAKSYLDTMAFSRQGLIDQLLYEGYTTEQATYGVQENGY